MQPWPIMLASRQNQLSCRDTFPEHLVETSKAKLIQENQVIFPDMLLLALFLRSSHMHTECRKTGVRHCTMACNF